MAPKEKIYHIYAKDRCLFHSIKEEEFSATWSALKGIVGLMKTNYEVSDLSYTEVYVNKEISQEASY